MNDVSFHQQFSAPIFLDARIIYYTIPFREVKEISTGIAEFFVRLQRLGIEKTSIA